ncbi:MAG TPA: hypothetical protein VGK02_05735 [Candidatus Aquicultor sp.]|jgi:hypothetical protein
MRKLVVGLLLLIALSQLPVFAESFKEEREGVQAAYGKAAGAYKTASDIYGKAGNRLSDESTAVKAPASTSQKSANPTGVKEDAGDRIGEQAASLITAVSSLAAEVKGTIAQDDMAHKGQSPGAGATKTASHK